MRDGQQSPAEPTNDEKFAQALDNIFGAETAAPLPVVEPAPEPPQQFEPVLSATPLAPPLPATPASGQSSQPRSLTRKLGIGCAVVVGLSVICVAALIVIGLAAGDDNDGSASVASSPTPEPSYTAVENSGTIADVTAIGTEAGLNDDWRVAVLYVIPDAAELVMPENQFNEPPADGRQFFIATVSVENLGPEPEVFPASYLFRAIGDSGYEYTTFNDFRGVIPDTFYDPVPPGTTVKGNVCWSVDYADAGSLVMRSDEDLGVYTEHYFSLGN